MAVIALRRSDLVAIVDDEDVDLVVPWKWYVRPHGQTYRVSANNKSGGTFRMHQLLLDFPAHAVDHRNGDGLDNRRENLRPATTQQNNWNRPATGLSSSYKGVCWKRNRRWPNSSRWCARITVDGQRLHLGYFREEEEAALAYDIAALKNFGEFARLNFPEWR